MADKDKPQPKPEKRDQDWPGPRKPTKQSVMENLDWITDRLSNQVRTVALGVLALSWGLLMGGSGAAIAVSAAYQSQLLMVALLAILVMFCDFMQYVSGYHNTMRLYRLMNKQGLDNAQYPEDIFYQGRKFFFAAKQWLTGVSVLWLGVLLVKSAI